MPTPEPLELDVREDIRSGNDPFGRIMAAVDSLAPGQPLVIVNSFEPVPLYAVMARKGFGHETAQTDDGNFRVTFTPGT